MKKGLGRRQTTKCGAKRQARTLSQDHATTVQEAESKVDPCASDPSDLLWYGPPHPWQGLNIRGTRLVRCTPAMSVGSVASESYRPNDLSVPWQIQVIVDFGTSVSMLIFEDEYLNECRDKN